MHIVFRAKVKYFMCSFFFLLIPSRPDITVITGDKRLHMYIYLYIMTDRRHSRCFSCRRRRPRPRHCHHNSLRLTILCSHETHYLFSFKCMYNIYKCSSFNSDDDYYEDGDQLWIKYNKLGVNVMHLYYG